VTALEFSQLFGPGELRRLFFTARPTELQLNRRQRIRELLRLSRLMDAYSLAEFRDPTSPPHQEMIDIIESLARKASKAEDDHAAPRRCVPAPDGLLRVYGRSDWRVDSPRNNSRRGARASPAKRLRLA